MEIEVILKNIETGKIARKGEELIFHLEDGSKICGSIYDIVDGDIIIDCNSINDCISVYHENIISFG